MRAIRAPSTSASDTNINRSEPAATNLNLGLPNSTAKAIFMAVLDSTPTPIAVAAIVGDSASATSFAMETVSASTSPRPSTAAEVNTPDAPHRSRATCTTIRTTWNRAAICSADFNRSGLVGDSSCVGTVVDLRVPTTRTTSAASAGAARYTPRGPAMVGFRIVVASRSRGNTHRVRADGAECERALERRFGSTHPGEGERHIRRRNQPSEQAGD